MYIRDLSVLRKKLSENGVNYKDIEFIMNQIKDSKLDGDFKKMNNSVYSSFVNIGIWDAFEKSLNDLGIEMTHTNNPEQ